MAFNPRSLDHFEEISLDSRRSRSVLLSKDNVHKWTMLRIWVNDAISKDISQVSSAPNDPPPPPRLFLQTKGLTTSLLLDPSSVKKGNRLQKEYGPHLDLNDNAGILPDNLFLVFGIPRAKSSKIPTLTSRLKNKSPDSRRKDEDDSDEDSDEDYKRVIRPPPPAVMDTFMKRSSTKHN